MSSKINLKLLNIFVFGSWIISLGIVLSIDIPAYFITTNPNEFHLFYLNWMSTTKFIAIILAMIAAVVFFIIAGLYNKIRKTKADKYLSTLILYTMLYQGIGHLVEAYFMLLASNLPDLVYVVGRYYYPLEILSFVIFTIVTFDVFILPARATGENERQNTWMISIGIAGAIVGYITTFFAYIPNMEFRIIVILIGLCLFGIIFVIVVYTCYRIFHLSNSVSEPTNKLALKVLGFQLLILTANVVLLILSEVASFVGFSDDFAYTMHSIKNGLYLVLAILYLFSFIRPSMSKKVETPVQE